MFDEADVKDVSEFRDSSEETDFVIGCGSLNGADEAVCSRIGLVGLHAINAADCFDGSLKPARTCDDENGGIVPSRGQRIILLFTL